MKRIYIAGPYSADNIIGVLDNIRSGTRVSTLVMMAGYAVFVPWLDFQLAFYVREGEEITKEMYQKNSLAWLETAHAVLVIEGWEKSLGTKREMDRARELGIPIYYSIEELIRNDSK